VGIHMGNAIQNEERRIDELPEAADSQALTAQLLKVKDLAQELCVSEAWVHDHARGRHEPKLTVITMGDQAIGMNTPTSLEVLTTADVAKLLRCCVRKVQKLARTRELPMKRCGKQFYITRQRLEEYLNK